MYGKHALIVISSVYEDIVNVFSTRTKAWTYSNISCHISFILSVNQTYIHLLITIHNIHKACRPFVVILLDWTPMFKGYIASFVCSLEWTFKNKKNKKYISITMRLEYVLKEIQRLYVVSIVKAFRSVYMLAQGKR